MTTKKETDRPVRLKPDHDMATKKETDILLGKRIQSIDIDATKQEYLRFNTDCGPVIFCAYGDCCSESWFCQLTGVAALLGGIVRVVEETKEDEELPKDGYTRQDYDKLYGIKITTDKGHTDLEFRNSSNGYYHGYIEEVTIDIHDAHKLSKIVWAAVTTDFPKRIS